MKRIYFLLIICLMTVPFMSNQDNEQLNYQMSIKAVSIPVFAVDRKGQPVHDLKQNEIEVHLNGKNVPFYLNRKSYINIIKKSKKINPNQNNSRLIYICFDTIFNNRVGLKKGKLLAKKLINNSNNIDEFVILQFSIRKGISLLGGPIKKSPELLSLIDNIEPKDAHNPNKFFSQNVKFFGEEGLFEKTDNVLVFSPEAEEPTPVQLLAAKANMKNQSSNSYNILIKIFASIFSKMEYLLKTVNQPKLVFLLSYGMNLEGEVISRQKPSQDANNNPDQKDIKKEDNELEIQDNQKSTRVYSQMFKNYMDKIALSINNGGSMLFTINPLNSNSGAASLKSMAEESGGKYYYGKNIDKIVENIHQDISAYYEISFQLEEDIKNPINLKYSCHRKGVRIKSIKSLKKIESFNKLSNVQKKAYLLDSFINNRWLKYFNNSKMVPFKEKLLEDSSYEYQVSLENLGVIGKDIETYLVSAKKGQSKYKFYINNKIADKNETFNVVKEKNNLYFFVIVNLKDSVCYFNKI